MEEENKRIALHTLNDFCIPLQNGAPGTPEREKSNKEIHDVLLKHGCELDDIANAGYFLTRNWKEENGAILFRNTKGVWEAVNRNWVIFESEHPDIFKGWDDAQRKMIVDGYND